jgi:photosystem II stability/assembly factor-like uncharacterized protein
MPEPDFAGLRTVAEHAVRQPGFATIERLADRRRGRLRLAAAVAAAVAVTAVAGTTALAVNRAAPGPPDAGTTTSVPPADGVHLVSFSVDGLHLYVTKGGCRPRDCPPELYASDDGGRHWERRTLPSDDQQTFGPALIGPGTLLMSAPDPNATPTPEPNPLGGPRQLYASTDGGRTWRPVGNTTTPIEVVPAGQRLLECTSMDLTEPCAAQTLDADLRVAPLANQPPIDVLWIQAHRPADLGLWVSGVDPSTRKPALAVSRDRGRTWNVSVFTAVAPVDASGGTVGLGNLPELFTADGRTAYVMQTRVMGTDELVIYHTVDGGETWRLIHPAERMQSFSFVTRDGAHVLMEQGNDGGIVARRASHNGGPYQPAKLFGLPGSGGLSGPPMPLGGGHGFVAQAANEPDALYMSDDGWTYRRLDLP